MSVSMRGLLGAMWHTVRALSLSALALVVVRWPAISETPKRGDATPQLSFIFFAVLPLIAFVLLGFLGDLWALLRRGAETPRICMRVGFAVVGGLLLLAMLARVVRA